MVVIEIGHALYIMYLPFGTTVVEDLALIKDFSYSNLLIKVRVVSFISFSSSIAVKIYQNTNL